MERIETVSLRADVSNYLANMRLVEAQTGKNTRAAAAARASLEAQHAAMREVGTGLVAVGAVATVAVALAVTRFVEFDQAMSNVSATTQETAENLSRLRDAALDAGGRTVYTATEAANAIEQLGRNGLETADILAGGLNGALNLAAAGQLDVARAAEIAAISMKQFGLEGSDIPHIADLLAAGAGKAAGDVEDLSQALNQSALVADQTGLSIEETTGVLAAFADAGLLGSDAGTSFKTMLQRLTPTSAEAAAQMKELGISAYDGAGNFIGAAEFAGVLHDGLKKLTTEERNAALATIFGSDAVRAATVLYAQGEEGIRDYIKQVNDAGYAARQAAERLNNLAGDVEKLGGSLDTALIKSGSGANEVLRFLVQSATEGVDAFGKLPTPVLTVGLALGTLTAAGALASGAFLIGVPKVHAYREAISKLGPTAQRTGRILEGVGKAAGVLALVASSLQLLSSLQGALEGAAVSAEKLQNALNVDPTAIKSLKTALEGALDPELLDTALEDVGKFIDAISNSPDTTWVPEWARDLLGVAKPLNNARDGLAKLGEEIATLDPDRAAETFQQLAKEAGGTEKAQLQLLNLMPAYKAALTEQATAVGLAATDQNLLLLAMAKGTPVTESAAGAYLEAADQAAALQSELQSLIVEINKANGMGQDAVTTNANYQKALADTADYIAQAQAGVEGYTLGFDENTAAGSANQEMIANQAKDLLAAAEAQLLLDGNVDNYLATVSAGQQTILDQAGALGASADQLQFIRDRVIAIPPQKSIDLIVEAGEAQRRIDNILASLGAFQSSGISLSAYVNEHYADGGLIPGAPSRRDNRIAMVATGEFITNATATALPANRTILEYMNAGGDVRHLQAYAGGGLVRPDYATNNRSFAAAPAQGPVTAYLDASVTRDIRALLNQHQQMLDTVGLASAAQSGSGRLAQLGAN